MHGIHEGEMSITSLIKLHVDPEDAFKKPDAVVVAPFGFEILKGLEFVLHTLGALSNYDGPYGAQVSF